MLYSWACKLDTGYKFREEQNINLLLTSSTLKEDKEISKLLNSGKNTDLQGFAADVANSGKLPCTFTVTIPLNKEWEILKSKKVYVYRYHDKTKNLEEIPGNIVKIDEDGLFTLPVIQGGKYVVLSKKPDSKLVTTLISQIKISVSKKTLSKGKTMNVKSTFPATILKVGKFTKDTRRLLPRAE